MPPKHLKDMLRLRTPCHVGAACPVHFINLLRYVRSCWMCIDTSTDWCWPLSALQDVPRAALLLTSHRRCAHAKLAKGNTYYLAGSTFSCLPRMWQMSFHTLCLCHAERLEREATGQGYCVLPVLDPPPADQCPPAPAQCGAAGAEARHEAA